MSLTLIHRVDEINIEDMHKLSMVKINYRGSFVGDFSERARVRIDNKRLFIVFSDVPKGDVLMKYYGNLIITSIRGYDRNNKIVKIRRKKVNDEIGNIKSKWDESKMNYEDYNKSNKYTGSIPTLISYTPAYNKVYKNASGKIIKENKLNQFQYNTLNRFRSNYGVK